MTGTFAIAREPTPVSPGGIAASAPLAESPDVIPLRADGLVGVYARRVLDRGGDLRLVAADARTARCGPTPSLESLGRGRAPFAAQAFGRGVERRRRPLDGAPHRAGREPRANGSARPPRAGRRLVAAGLAMAVMLPIGALIARAAEPTIAVATIDARPAGAMRVAPISSSGVIDLGQDRLARVAP